MPKATNPKSPARTTKPAKPPSKKPAPKTAAKAVDAEVPAPSGKLGALIGLMRRPDGATLADLMAATEWQAHSVRGAISGALKKRLGLTIVSARDEGVRTYRITG